MRVGFLLLNIVKDVLDWGRTISCLEKYGHEGVMIGYDFKYRDYESYIKKHKIDMLVIGEDHTDWPFYFCKYARENNFPVLNVVSEGIVSDFTSDSFFDEI